MRAFHLPILLFLIRSSFLPIYNGLLPAPQALAALFHPFIARTLLSMAPLMKSSGPALLVPRSPLVPHLPKQ